MIKKVIIILATLLFVEYYVPGGVKAADCYPPVPDLGKVRWNHGDNRKSNGVVARCHAGIDLYTDGTSGAVTAIADGKVLAVDHDWYKCSGGVSGGIMVEHTIGGVTKSVWYGEINASTIRKTVGQMVRAGENLGTATACGMLHLELYNQGTTRTERWPKPCSKGSTQNKPANLNDSTQFIRNLVDGRCSFGTGESEGNVQPGQDGSVGINSLTGGLFIGDSLTEGMRAWIEADGGQVMARTGVGAAYWSGQINTFPNEPKFVFVMLGTNGTNLNDTIALLRLLKGKYDGKNIPIMVGAILPPGHNVSGGMNLTKEAAENYNLGLKSFVQSNGMTWIETSTGLVDGEGYLADEWTVDGIHLGKNNGYGQLVGNVKAGVTGGSGGAAAGTVVSAATSGQGRICVGDCPMTALPLTGNLATILGSCQKISYGESINDMNWRAVAYKGVYQARPGYNTPHWGQGDQAGGTPATYGNNCSTSSVGCYMTSVAMMVGGFYGIDCIDKIFEVLNPLIIGCDMPAMSAVAPALGLEVKGTLQPGNSASNRDIIVNALQSGNMIVPKISYDAANRHHDSHFVLYMSLHPTNSNYVLVLDPSGVNYGTTRYVYIDDAVKMLNSEATSAIVGPPSTGEGN